MRRIAQAVIVALAFASLSACVSTGFLGFLTTTKQMDLELEARDQEIAALKAELAGYRALKADAEEAIRQVAETRTMVEERMESLPVDTIRRIIEILRAALP
jgi:hypothetical protein